MSKRNIFFYSAVVKFARATGDLHALSSVDTRLIALARTLEISYYGHEHVRDFPLPPRETTKKVKESKTLPGWGAQGGSWEVLDKMHEDELAAAEAALAGNAVEGVTHSTTSSRIASEIRKLDLEDEIVDSMISDRNMIQNQAIEFGKDRSVSEENMKQDNAPGASDGNNHDDDNDDDDDDGWEVAAKNRNKARKARRKAVRQQQREQETEMDNASQNESSMMISTEGNESMCANSAGDNSLEMAEDNGDSGDEVSANNSDKDSDIESVQEEENDILSHDSLISCITGDFAMQNVLLQMGLKLVSPGDGRRIHSVSRWALRCSACFQVTKEVGRLFCPRCGNSTLDKVRVKVGPDGSEQFGIKKKHILRGTKFPLPKPKGGRARELILREDQLMSKQHLLRAQRKKEEAIKASLDPFAPEYGDETWHQAAALPHGGIGASALLAGWKKNPNERKHVATNRRRK